MSKIRKNSYVTWTELEDRREDDRLVEAFTWKLIAHLLLHGVHPRRWSTLHLDFVREDDGDYTCVVTTEDEDA